jgi:hypothetical protein
LPAISASKNDRARRGWSKTMVLETPACRIEHSCQYPASRSLLPKGIGMRCSHRWAKTSMVPGWSQSQISRSPAGSSQDANHPAVP